jgi:endonuclease YncB( thermonuclease family)
LEIVILILLFAGVLIYALRSKNTDSDYTPPSRSDYPPQSRPATRQRAEAEPEPFDAAKVTSEPTKSVLQGSAYVVDGDTLVIKKTQVRLFGVDAPEMNHPYGKKAKWALVSLCKGQIVHAKVTDQDTHGRTVAKCHLEDGRDLSAEMVKLGLAIDWPKFSGGKYRSLELPDVRKKLWLADARQKGRMYVWEKFEAKK